MKVGSWVLARHEIYGIDCSELASNLSICVYHKHGTTEIQGNPAIDLLMEIRPSALEGRRLKFARHAWAFHNLMAHPLLQILTWLGARELGMRLHDMTVPHPES